MIMVSLKHIEWPRMYIVSAINELNYHIVGEDSDAIPINQTPVVLIIMINILSLSAKRAGCLESITKTT